MPSLRTILVTLLVNSLCWTIISSYLLPRQFRFTTPIRVNNRESTPLQAKVVNDDLAQAYQRLGEKILKGKGEKVTFSTPPPPPPPPIATPEPPIGFDSASTLTIPTPNFDEVSEKASQSVEKASQSVANVVSETIQRAQETYQGASQALTDSPRQPGIAPNFVDFIKNNLAKVKASGDDIDAWGPIKEKLAILQQNTLDFFEIPTDGSLFQPKGAAIVNFIHSEKFAWYAVAVLFILAVTQRQSGVEAARDDLNAIVFSSERKAKDAAEAANQAAQGAAQALKMTEAALAQKAAIEAEKVEMAVELEKMKNEVKDLKTQLNEKHVKSSKAAADQATIEALEEGKATMQAELAQRSADIEKLRAEVKVKEINESKSAADAATIEALENDKATLKGNLQTMEGEIESLRGELIEQQSKAAKAASDAATIELLQKENASLQSEVGRLSRETEELRLRVEQLAALIPSAVEVEPEQVATPVTAEDIEVEPPAPTQVLNEVEAPSTTPVLTDEDDDEEDELVTAPAATPAAEAEAPTKKAIKKKSTTKTAATKTATTKTPTTKTAKTAKKKEVVEVVEEDWKSLSLTTLKRKSIKDLTDYLESKGVTTIDDEGKPLKKSDLVDAVLSM